MARSSKNCETATAWSVGAVPASGAMAGVFPARSWLSPANTASRSACVPPRRRTSSSISRASSPEATTAPVVRSYLSWVGRLRLEPLNPVRVDGTHGMRGSAGVRSQVSPLVPSPLTMA